MNDDVVENLSDEELVEVVRNRDPELYREIVQRYQGRLVRYAAYLIRDSEKAVDVVQEAFIKAYVNLRGFNCDKKFSSWIYRIVHNEAINFAKRYGRDVSLESNEWISETYASEVDVEESVRKVEMKKMMNSCLEQLPFKYREPLILFFLEDKSYGEISDILRMPVGTVGTRVNRGKKLLKIIWQKEGGEKYVR